MGKVIDSAGLQQFLNDGTVTHVPNHKADKPNGAPPLEVQKQVAAVELGEKKPEIEVDKALESAIEAEESVPTLSEDSRKYVNKQHRLRKEAQEDAELDRRLAQEQYNRAVLAEDRAKALELELSKNKAPVEGAKVEALKFPMAADFVKDGQFNQDEYQKAVTEYNKAETKRLFEEERQVRDLAQLQKKLGDSADAARKAHSDFDEVMSAAKDTPADMVPQFVLTYINESDIAGEISYYLLKNPEDSQRIARLSPIRGIAELGKLEERLTKAPEPAKPVVAEVKPPERPGAPPPITPLNTSGSGTVNLDPAKMSFKELRAMEREKLRKK
jgi:hypothetical protein